MNLIILTQNTTPIIGQVAWLLGKIMNGIFYVIDFIGIPNIGLAIILFTIVVNLLMMPLNIKQQKFSKLQVKMSPEIQAIESKYKGRSDQESLMAKNQEIQMVYAKYGVSASGSCLTADPDAHFVRPVPGDLPDAGLCYTDRKYF